MNELWQSIRDPLLDYSGRALGAALIVVVGRLAVHFLVGPLRRMLDRSRADPSVSSFLVNSARSAILVVVLLGVLQQLGVHTTSLLTLLGAAGLAVALSLQGSLANFASGLLLLSFRMVHAGDLIEVGDIRGRVHEMLPFHIVLITADNQRVTVPNTSLTSGAVRNHSALPQRRAQWTLTLKPDDDLEASREALLQALRDDKRILTEPAPQLYVQEWTDDKRVLAITAWVATVDYQTVQQELLETLGTRLAKRREARP